MDEYQVPLRNIKGFIFRRVRHSLFAAGNVHFRINRSAGRNNALDHERNATWVTAAAMFLKRKAARPLDIRLSEIVKRDDSIDPFVA